jgi:hypothetical protein
MPQHLIASAEKRHREAVERATAALHRLSAARKAITFASVAREAGVSTDFLYRQPQLRQRIQELRTTTGNGRHTVPDEEPNRGSAPVRALSAQIKELRQRHHHEVTDLKSALAAAHGENLALRRKLATYE